MTLVMTTMTSLLRGFYTPCQRVHFWGAKNTRATLLLFFFYCISATAARGPLMRHILFMHMQIYRLFAGQSSILKVPSVQKGCGSCLKATPLSESLSVTHICTLQCTFYCLGVPSVSLLRGFFFSLQHLATVLLRRTWNQLLSLRSVFLK